MSVKPVKRVEIVWSGRSEDYSQHHLFENQYFVCSVRMQERRQQMKIPPAWQPDEWICHHSGSRQSTGMDNYSVYQQSKNRSAISYRTLERSPTPKRISTAKLRRRKCVQIMDIFENKSRSSLITYRNREFKSEKCRISSICPSIESQTVT